jgi:hypothetical protein
MARCVLPVGGRYTPEQSCRADRGARPAVRPRRESGTRRRGWGWTGRVFGSADVGAVCAREEYECEWGDTIQNHTDGGLVRLRALFRRLGGRQ